MPVSWLDVILAAIMLLSGFLAMLRGLTREVLSIMSWVAAAVATIILYPIYVDQATQYIQPDLLAKGVLGVGIFLVTLIVVSLITSRISDRVLDSRVGALDRTLGFVFGLARGLVLVVIGFLFFTWVVSVENQPPWLREARSLPIIKQTGDAILSLLPENPEEIIPGLKPKEESATQPGQRSEAQGGGRIAVKRPSEYQQSERRGLNQLLETTEQPGQPRQ